MHAFGQNITRVLSMKKSVTSTIENIWKFVRGDTLLYEFEEWFYQTEELESQMPADLHFEVLSFNFKKHSDTELKAIKKQLREWLESTYQYQCPCIKLQDFDERFDIQASYNIKEYTLILNHLENSCQSICAKNDHMKMLLCLHCNTHWYIGNDLFRDGFLLKRLNTTEITNIQNLNQWPTDFDARFDKNFQIKF